MAIVVADGRRALAVGRPIVAGLVTLLPREIGGPVLLRPGQNVVLIRTVTSALDGVPALVDRGPVVYVREDMQLIQVRCDQLAVRVIPRPLANTASCRDAALPVALRGKIGAPDTVAGAGRLAPPVDMSPPAADDVEVIPPRRRQRRL